MFPLETVDAAHHPRRPFLLGGVKSLAAMSKNGEVLRLRVEVPQSPSAERTPFSISVRVTAYSCEDSCGLGPGLHDAR
ncbi:MAG: hypothetical protein V3R37_08390 [Rhodospirillales bacterium]